MRPSHSECHSGRQPGRAAAASVLALLLCCAQAASSAEIKDQTLRYAALYGSRNAGEIKIDIRSENDGYTVTSTTKPSRLAAMFIKSQISHTRFIRQQGELALDSGAERLAGDQATGRSFRVNYARGQVEFSNGKHGTIQPGDQLEAAAFPLLLMLRPVETIAATRVWEVSPRRMRDYLYEKPVEETVTVPAGEFTGWKITRRRTNRPDDSVSVWLNQAGNPVPVKIVIIKRGKTSTLQLLGQ